MAFIIGVLIVLAYFLYKDRIKGALIWLGILAGALTFVYGLVKFVKWAWYN